MFITCRFHTFYEQVMRVSYLCFFFFVCLFFCFVFSFCLLKLGFD